MMSDGKTTMAVWSVPTIGCARRFPAVENGQTIGGRIAGRLQRKWVVRVGGMAVSGRGQLSQRFSLFAGKQGGIGCYCTCHPEVWVVVGLEALAHSFG